MSKIEFDMRISGDVEKINGNGSVAKFELSTATFGKEDHGDMTIQEATEAITAISKGLITSIAPILVKDRSNKLAVNEAIKFVVGQLALDVGVDLQALMLAELKAEIEGKNNEQ